MRARQYDVYIMASHSRRLYIGCTSDLAKRVAEHRLGVYRGHTARYRIHRLVYFETTGDPRSAVARERQLKGWSRERKMRLIESVNAGWIDLSPD